jgi:AcrR family transcriptional regulator
MLPADKSTRARRRDASIADRAAILEAVYLLVPQHGTALPSVADICRRAAIDRTTFERHFESLDGCIQTAWEEVIQQFAGFVAPAFAAAEGWRGGLRAAAWGYCHFLQENPAKARFSVELSLASEPIQAWRDFIMDGWAELIHLGRFESRQAAGVPRAQAEAIVGAIWERQVKTIREDAFDRLPQLIPEAMYFTVLPYLGAEAAEEELRRGPADIERYNRGEL